MKFLYNVARLPKRLAYWFFLTFVIKPKAFLRLIKNKELFCHSSYFPEYKEKRKSTSRIFWEQCIHIAKYGNPEFFYFPYGLDVKSKEECNRYLNYEPFYNKRENLNFSNRVNCTCILRDKILFNIFANGIGIATPENEFYTVNGQLYDFKTKKPLSIDELCANDHSLFCKLVDGECGNGVFQLRITDGKVYINDAPTSRDDLGKRFAQGRYIAQTIIKQHPLMNQLHSKSINSMRLITVRSLKDKTIHVFPSILRVGTGNSIVDNTSQGGLAVGIDLTTGKLKQYGFYKPQFGLKVDSHPDSNIRFNQFVIPFFEEARRQAVYFHSMLPDLHSVGWDIAIGEKGPIFIEGNDNWEINGPQICNGGLRKEFNELFYK